jgi:hypothetical protein
MTGRIYEFPNSKSRSSPLEVLAQAIRAITPAVNKIAEELHRQSTIRTLRGIAVRERREGRSGANPQSPSKTRHTDAI